MIGEIILQWFVGYVLGLMVGCSKRLYFVVVLMISFGLIVIGLYSGADVLYSGS